MNGIHLYFVNKHPSSWPLLGLKAITRLQNFRLVQIETNRRRYFKVHLNEKLVPYQVENIVRKGEIACYNQFLLFSQCFLPLVCQNASLCGNGISHYQVTNFRLLDTERVCRRQFQI